MKRQLFHILCCLVVPLLCSVSVHAAATLSIEPVEVMRKGETTVQAVFTSEEAFTGFQTELTLPDGLEPVETEGRYAVLPEAIAATHQISSRLEGNTLKIVAFSADNAPCPAEGVLFTIRMRPRSGFRSGDASVRNTIFTTPDFYDITVPDATTTLSAEVPVLGAATLSIDPVEVARKGETTLSAVFSSEEAFTGFQTELTLPDGLEPVDTEGRYAVLPEDIAATHQISSRLDGNVLKIVAFSADNAECPAEGVLFTIRVRPRSGFRSGEATVRNTIFTTPDFYDVAVPDATTTLSAEVPVLGAATLSIDPVEVARKGETTVQAVFSSEEAFTGFQTELTLPDGLDPVETEGSYAVLPEAIATTHQISSRLEGNTLKIVAFSADNAPCPAEGVLFAIRVRPRSGFRSGEATVRNTIFTTPDFYDIAVPDAATTLSAEVPVLGAATLSIEPAEVARKGATTLSAVFSSEEAFTGFQTELTLPDGLEPVETEGSYAVLPEDIATTHQISSRLEGNTLKIVAFSADNTECPAEGVLFTILVQPRSGFRSGEASVQNTIFTTPDFYDVAVPDATTTLTAEVLAESIELNLAEATLRVGDKVELTAKVEPEDAVDTTVTWQTSDPAVATVDADGVVSALALGEATITATCADVSAMCVITVEPTPAEALELDVLEAELRVNESVQLTATVLPEDATDKTVTWTSSDEAVATVSADGLVTALSLGHATITATCGTVSASCDVTVIPTPAEGLDLNVLEAELRVNESVQLTATVLPEDATDKTVTWKSSDDAVATVSADGLVTARALGHATITATCGTASASCDVTVIPTPAEGLELNVLEAELRVNESVQLTATVLPEDATDKTVTWSSSDETVATVDADGLVTALSLGHATITATCGPVSASCEVTVIPTPAQGLELNLLEAELRVNESVQLTATVLPEDATDKTVTWTSSDEAVATIDADGLVTARALGHATITATCGPVSASCEITVVPVLVESIVIAPEAWSGDVGETVQLTATVLPEDATDKTITWKSSNEAVATVDTTGLLTMQKSGTCVITAEANDGSGVKAQCTVTGLSGLDAILADSDAEVDVYGIDGTLLVRGCDREHLRQLVPGTYILRNGERVVKTIVK